MWSPDKYEKISRLLKALAHPVRSKIVEGLLEDECNVPQIQKKIVLPQSTISQHLRILKDAGIIKGRRERTKVCYKVVSPVARRIISISPYFVQNYIIRSSLKV